MNLLLHRAFLALVAAGLMGVGASAHAAASAESVDRLMQAMQVQRQLEAVHTQTLPAMQNAMRQAMQIARDESTRARSDGMKPASGAKR